MQIEPLVKRESLDDAKETNHSSKRVKTEKNPVSIAMKSETNKWWENKEVEEENDNPNIKWIDLEHNGVIFPEPFKTEGVTVDYKGEAVKLSNFQEEIAVYWVQSIGGEWENKTHYRENFKELFLNSFEGTTLLDKHKELDFDGFSFDNVKRMVERNKELKSQQTKEERKKLKEIKDKREEKYKNAIVDGRLEKLSNFRIEPRGLFKGRGDHPKAGTLKQLTKPEDIKLNCSTRALVPICPLPGRCWGDILNNKESSWLASYDESCTGNKKYVFLGAGSKIKGKKDMMKYEKARQLKDKIGGIREDYNVKMRNDQERVRQLATAAYLIDFLAIRVGNEKKEDEADTVGCCSLRVEHIRFEEDNKITLDFLGKDSMQYLNTVKIDVQAYQNLKVFTANKQPNEDIFNLINSSKLNEYLQSLMEGLTAKVFRTYNASMTLQKELNKVAETMKPTDPVEKKLDAYELANRRVAILCNHQKGVSKNFDEVSEKQAQKIEDMKKEMRQLKKNKETGKYNKMKERVAKAEKQLEKRIQNKSVALNTSKINYNDPRISVSWCKSMSMPIEKIFTSVLLEKFVWAMPTTSVWKF